MLLPPFSQPTAPTGALAPGETGPKPKPWRLAVGTITVTGLLAGVLAGCGGGNPGADKSTEKPAPGVTQQEPDPSAPSTPKDQDFTPIGKVTLGPAEVMLQDLSQITGVTVLGPDEFLLVNGRTGELQWARGKTQPQPVVGTAAQEIQQSLDQAKLDLADQLATDPDGGNPQAIAMRPLPQVLDVITSPTFAEDQQLYLFVSTGQSSAVFRAEWQDGTLESLTEILADLPAGAGRNGGALGFGPDGNLFVSVGDTGQPALAQDPTKLAGKILRVAPDGSIPSNNPLTGSPVWSMGHRNVTSLAWTQTAELYAVEQGQVVADELNLIIPGANYGWPLVEGRGNVSSAAETGTPDGARTGTVNPDGTAPDNATLDKDALATPRDQTPSGQAPTDGALPNEVPTNDADRDALGDGGASGETTPSDTSALDGPATVNQLTVQEAHERGFTAPALQWDWTAGRTTSGDPVSLVATSEGLYIAGFHGERLWRVGLLRNGLGLADEFNPREFGPLGQVVVSADDTLLVLATNTNPNPGAGSISLPTKFVDEVTAPQDDSLLKFKVTY
ncbi:PQQ-dependent sugar dehydrogenase [Jonesiaceae bacterium BS-20]|uniref:PQQ-dependent sugar dehydrogenase n=1 Tax=Jonesiaceae bacterium BS-20 TaxID=3120821 RepID=A0AAU7DVV5_9MICO